MALKVSVVLLFVVATMTMAAAARSEATDASTRHLAAMAGATIRSEGAAGVFHRKLLQTCWMKVSDLEPCDSGWNLFCCNGDGTDAQCLGPANNRQRCTAQYDGAHVANWCKNNSC